MKAVVAAFNQEKALVGAFSVITNLRMELFQALVNTVQTKATKLIIVGDETTQLQSIPKHFSPVGGGNSYAVIRMEFHPSNTTFHMLRKSQLGHTGYRISSAN